MKLRRLGRFLFVNTIIFSVLLVVSEVVLSLVIDSPQGYYVYDPNSEFRFGVDPKYIEGIDEDTSVVRFNSLGARSSELDDGIHHKIMAIGGSTTACFALNEDKVWTSLLARKLGEGYWVGNFGRLGNDTNHHVYQTEHLLEHEGLKDAEAVLFLIGFNDFGHFLAKGSDYTQMSEYASKLSGFAQIPDSEKPFYRRLSLFKLLRKAKHKMVSLQTNSSYGAIQHEMRLQRLAQAHKNELPNMKEALTRYEKNIRSIIGKMKARNISPIFMTQPTLWKEGLKEEYEQLLLMGGGYDEDNPDKLIYYSTGALAKGMEQFNDLLIEICKEEGVLCFDLAEVVPKTTNAFYDDCHFNISGAKIVADQLYQFLKENYLEGI